MVVSFVYVVAMALGLGRPGEGVGNRTACAEGIEPPDFGHGAGRPVCQSYGSTQLLVRPLPAGGCGDESSDPGATNTSGITLDGYPIHGDRDIDGVQLTTADLDECNGITSPTPEFPEGVYHYVLLDVADSTSSIRCFTGVVDPSLSAMTGMPGMGGGPPRP